MRTLFMAGVMALALMGPSLAADEPSVVVTLSNHAFQPAEVVVPAGRTFTLVVRNQDRMVEKFVSTGLGVEKLLPGGEDVSLRLGPLKAGAYEFHGDLHSDTAKGRLVAR